MNQFNEAFVKNGSNHVIVFGLDEQHYALRLSNVEQIICMIAITPLPHAPAIILGVVNIRGRIVPVFHVRKRFGLQEREIGLRDHLIIAHTSSRAVALVVDRVMDVVALSEEQMSWPEQILSGLDYVEGVAKLEDGVVFIHDLDTFLSIDEAETLERAMSA